MRHTYKKIGLVFLTFSVIILLWPEKRRDEMNPECPLPPQKVVTDTMKRTAFPVRVLETVPDLPFIYFVTPTYARNEQIADMTRLSQTLAHVPNLHWLVAEDASQDNQEIIELLERMNMNFTYMLAAKSNGSEGRGVPGRRAAFEWVVKNVDEGVLYLGDDDNTYDLRLFDEMRYIEKIGMWPVGLMKKWGLTTPICKNGKVTGYFDGWRGGRVFPVDMAEFAVNIKLIKQVMREKPFQFRYRVKRIETGFLEDLGINRHDIEAKADDCTKIYVWHTKTVHTDPYTSKPFEIFAGKNNNVEFLGNHLQRQRERQSRGSVSEETVP